MKKQELEILEDYFKKAKASAIKASREKWKSGESDEEDVWSSHRYQGMVDAFDEALRVLSTLKAGLE